MRQAIINGILNWQTTLLGALGLVYAIIENVDVIIGGDTHDILKVMLPAIGVFLLSLFSKDASRTGVATEKEPKLR